MTIRAFSQKDKKRLEYLMSNTRLMAVKSLSDIETKKFLLKQAIDLNAGQLDKRDRAFLMEIVYGVLRLRNALDWILTNFLKKPSALGTFTMNNLRTALSRYTT